MNENEELVTNEMAGGDTPENVTVSEPEVSVEATEPSMVTATDTAPAEVNPPTEGTTAENTENAENAPVTKDAQQNVAQPAAMPRTVTEAEWKELVDAHPEIIGQKLPDDIFKACITSEKSPLQVYDSMMLKQTQNQMAFLNAENARLKKELENFHRAPVVPTEGGAPSNEPKDPILEGFMRYR